MRLPPRGDWFAVPRSISSAKEKMLPPTIHLRTQYATAINLIISILQSTGFTVYQSIEKFNDLDFIYFIATIGNQLSSLACLPHNVYSITEWDLKHFHLFGIRKLLGATLCSPSLTALATADSYTRRKQNNQEVMNYKHR